LNNELEIILMANPGEPTIVLGATGPAVRRLQRALRRTPNLGLKVDGIFGPEVEAAVKNFQQGAGLLANGVVDAATWNCLAGWRSDANPQGRIVRRRRSVPPNPAYEWSAEAVGHNPARY
jgi:peptidoglycan hydrolase-like protein with peptidoglycan-binding domain